MAGTECGEGRRRTLECHVDGTVHRVFWLAAKLAARVPKWVISARFRFLYFVYFVRFGSLAIESIGFASWVTSASPRKRTQIGAAQTHPAKRFNELRKSLGSISQRMLTLTLRALERDGLVTRTAYPTIPPRVDYALTRLGRSLLEPVSELGLWARKNRDAIAEARARFDAGQARQ